MRRLAAEYLICATLLFGVAAGLGQDLVSAAALSLCAAQVLVLVRLGLGLTRNPVSFWASRRSTEDPLRLIATQATIETNKTSAQTSFLEAAGYRSVVTARATSPQGEPLYDVYQRHDSTTTLALGRFGGTRVLTSRLRDGRLLISTDLLVPPSSQLIVNVVVDRSVEVVSGDDEQDRLLPILLSSHQRIVEGLRAKGVFVEPAHASLFVEMLNQEQRNFNEIGPFLTPFLSLRPHRSPLQLSLVLSPLAVLARSQLARQDRVERSETNVSSTMPQSHFSQRSSEATYPDLTSLGSLATPSGATTAN